MMRELTWLCIGLSALPAMAAATGGEYGDANPTPADHVRIATWNIEVFNLRNAHPMHAGNPNGPRTDAQLEDLADRIIGFDASIIALQEMNEVPALRDLATRMNDGEVGPWKVVANDVGFEQQNSLLYDDSRVDLVGGEHVLFVSGIGLYPHEAGFRAPVTGVFSPEGNPQASFRVIGIHGSFDTEQKRADQGLWLSNYVEGLLADGDETHQIVLTGDFNGTPVAGDAPHDGIVSGGDLTYVPKRNGDSTAIGGPAIDHFYVTADAMANLTDPTSFVIRNDFYGETTIEFRATYSDHFPVIIDYEVGPVPEPGTAISLFAVGGALLVARPGRSRRWSGRSSSEGNSTGLASRATDSR